MEDILAGYSKLGPSSCIQTVPKPTERNNKVAKEEIELSLNIKDF